MLHISWFGTDFQYEKILIEFKIIFKKQYVHLAKFTTRSYLPSIIFLILIVLRRGKKDKEEKSTQSVFIELKLEKSLRSFLFGGAMCR